MQESGRLSLNMIRSKRVPGVGTGPGREVVPLYTSAAVGPEVTHYLLTALDDAIRLLRQARATATSEIGLKSTTTSGGSKRWASASSFLR